MSHLTSHIEQARICVTLAVEHLTHACADAYPDVQDNLRHRIAGLASQGLELNALHAFYLDPNAELEAMLGAPVTEVTA